MLVKEDIERSGFFWLPGKDDYKAPGILRISSGGNISLELVGSFVGPTGTIKELTQDMTIGRIVGHVEKSGLVTLENCFFIKRPFAFGGITKSQIAVNWAVLGVAFDADEEILFDGFRVSIEGLDQWMGVSGITVELDDDLKSFAVKYERPDNVKLVEIDGLAVSVGFGYTIPSGNQINEAKVTQNAHLKASTTERKNLSFFTDVFGRLKDFLCFALDETVSLHDITAYNSTITDEAPDGHLKSARMDVYYGSINHLDERPKLKQHKSLFRYVDVPDNAEKILAAWLSLYDLINPVMNLYFAAKAGAHKYIDSRFLALAQALETLHRRTSVETVMEPDEFSKLVEDLVEHCPAKHKEWLGQRLTYGNEISLARRIGDLLEAFPKQFGDKKKRKAIARMMVDTRNYLTHYDEKLLGKAAKGRTLWKLCMKMEALLQLHFLKTLSFTEEQIDYICSQSHDLNQKLKVEFGAT